MRHRVAYLVFPAFWLAGLLATWLALGSSLPVEAVSTAVLFPLALVIGICERAWPGRPEFRELDQPLGLELANFFANWGLGYTLALALCAGVAWALERAGVRSPWPAHWPMAAQVLVACALSEGISYWQHRLYHRVPALWRFHELHHLGGRLNMVRAGRFNFADIGPAALATYLPLVVLAAPPVVVCWLSLLTGLMGLLQHANIGMPTPRWLAPVLGTPAWHRLHHSTEEGESNANFGTVTPLFDVLFGTFRAPAADWPAAVGVTGRQLPRAFRSQLFPT